MTLPGELIIGYDVDQDGTLGLVTSGSKVDTFDVASGVITGGFPSKSTKQQYAVEAIAGGNVGLIQRIDPSLIRRYSLVAPFTTHHFTGHWTPPVSDIEIRPAVDQARHTGAFYAFELNNNDLPVIFSSNVAANTFGHVINLDPNKFTPNLQPRVGYYPPANEAVIAVSPDGGARGGMAPINYLIDLDSGKISSFAGFNNGPFHAGSVQGMALDPNTGIEVTTTELNSSVEFYNVVTRKPITVVQPPCTNDGFQGFANGVAVDPVNKLFLVAGTACKGTSFVSGLDVYDESANLVEAIPGFGFFPAQPPAVVDPAIRTGWILGPQANQLQQFFY
jgi:hypothetical protein